MDTNTSDRLVCIATVTKQAADVFGSHAAAEHWLATPAIGLDQRRPVDLLQSAEGTDLVTALLTRIDHCVYT
jgi:putative toxin-antitoxin system antitoxin component (TIGR02293 family)